MHMNVYMCVCALWFINTHACCYSIRGHWKKSQGWWGCGACCFPPWFLLYTLTPVLVASEVYHLVIATNLHGNRITGKLKGNKRKYVQGGSRTARGGSRRDQIVGLLSGNSAWWMESDLPFHLNSYKMETPTPKQWMYKVVRLKQIKRKNYWQYPPKKAREILSMPNRR